MTKNLGHVTAYAYAKSKGYTGTEEEFAAEQAQFAQNAQQVAEDAEQVAADRDAVELAKTSVERITNTFETVTVPEAVQSVQDEGTTQVAAVNEAGGTQVDAVEDKGREVLESIPADYSQMTEDVSGLKADLTRLDNISLSLKEIPIKSAVAGWKLNNDGSFVSATGWNVKQSEVTEGDVLFVKSSYVWKFETGISTGTVGDVHVGKYEGFVTIPSTAAYIAVSTPISENANHGAYLFENIVNGLLEKERLFPPFETHEELGMLQDNGQFLYGETYHSTVTNRIACSEGDVFYYYGFVSKYAVTALFYGKTGNIVQAIKSIDDVSGYQHFTITAPQNAASVIFTSYNTLNNIPPLVVTMSRSYRSPLAWKKWYACGDSFTYGGYGDTAHVFTSGKYVGKNMVYSYFIGNRTNCDVQNIALDGMTMATHNGDSNNFTNTSNNYNYTTITDDADYVTLYFGINDNGKGVPVGDVDDTEKTTFCGAYNFVLDNLTTRLSHGKIGIIVSNEIPQSFVDATIAIARKWGIPYLDLNYDESVPLMCGSLRPTASQTIKDKRNAQFRISEANHHPNTTAHEYESYFIEEWLLKL